MRSESTKLQRRYDSSEERSIKNRSPTQSPKLRSPTRSPTISPSKLPSTISPERSREISPTSPEFKIKLNKQLESKRPHLADLRDRQSSVEVVMTVEDGFNSKKRVKL